MRMKSVAWRNCLNTHLKLDTPGEELTSLLLKLKTRKWIGLRLSKSAAGKLMVRPVMPKIKIIINQMNVFHKCMYVAQHN